MSKEQTESKPKPFAGQHDNEDVKLVFHQHPVVMRKALIFGMLALLVPLLPVLAWPQFYSIGFKIFGLILAGVIGFWIREGIGWYYSVYIVTDQRIIEIKQRGFFNRRVSEFNLDRVQNVNYHVKGLQAVLFQFGDITVQTYVGDLIMKTIYKPVLIHSRIVDVVRTVNPSTPPGI